MSDNCPRGNFEQFVSPSSYNRKRILVEFLTQDLASVCKTHNVVEGPFDKGTTKIGRDFGDHSMQCDFWMESSESNSYM